MLPVTCRPRIRFSVGVLGPSQLGCLRLFAPLHPFNLAEKQPQLIPSFEDHRDGPRWMGDDGLGWLWRRERRRQG